ncbi:MAG: branched-chain amino acid aminotransferase [Bifidobacteriaceae bacterium]|jgi:branched-chain amino acid aminotransferase|nr:branched-chain amino acid aminotransferase [Bifidobacteriaceae bacterium]
MTASTNGAHAFAVEPNPNPRTNAEREAELAHPAFGLAFTDHMARLSWTAGEGWSDRRVVPYGLIALDPAAAVLHYAQEIFEGLKAYRHADDSIWTFRPTANAERFTRSARRLALPELDPKDFLGAIEALVREDRAWVPAGADTSLYLRPFMFATEAFIGVRPSHTVEFFLIASPVGSYFANGVAPVGIWVERTTHRAGPGGTGSAKCGGNYAGAMAAQESAYAHGCEQVLYLDAVRGEYLEELGGMNIVVVFDDGTAATPPISGTILEGVTRSSILQLLADRGVDVAERPVALAEVVDGARTGRVAEVFACGTAAVMTPVGRLKGDDFEVEVGDGGAGELTMSVRAELTDIQYGRIEDRHGWTHRLI